MGHDPSWVVIVNPASANGRTGRDWKGQESLLRSILPPFKVWETTHPGHARELAQEAAALGFSVIAVHGGDGTFNEVVNGFFPHSSGEISLAFLPSGTGADLVRTLGISHSLSEAARQARRGTGQPVDIGSVQFHDLEGREARRYFVNVTDAGFGGDLVRYVNSHSKRWGGRISFFQGLLLTLFRYKNKKVRITIEDGDIFDQQASSIVVANGQYFGGGMWVAPEARLDDGLFELVIIGDVTKREVLTNVGLLYRGTIATHPKVKTYKAKTITLTSEEEVLIDLDGELVGRLPARFQILPGALSVIR